MGAQANNNNLTVTIKGSYNGLPIPSPIANVAPTAPLTQTTFGSNNNLSVNITNLSATSAAQGDNVGQVATEGNTFAANITGQSDKVAQAERNTSTSAKDKSTVNINGNANNVGVYFTSAQYTTQTTSKGAVTTATTPNSSSINIFGDLNTVTENINGAGNNSTLCIGAAGVSYIGRTSVSNASSGNTVNLTQNGNGNSAGISITNSPIYGSGGNKVNATQAGNDSFYASVTGSNNTLNITQAPNKIYGGILSVTGKNVTVTKVQ